MSIWRGRPVRLYESALRDVRYVFGRPVAVPFRKNFDCAAKHKAEIDRLNAARERVENEEMVRAVPRWAS